MKIAFTNYEIGIGGVAQFIITLGKALLAHGHDVTVVTYNKGVSWERLADAGLTGECLPIGHWESHVQHTRRVARYLAHTGFDAVVSNIGVNNLTGQQCLRFLPKHLIRLLVLHIEFYRVYQLANINRDAWNMAVAVSSAVQLKASEQFPEKQIRCIPNGIQCPTNAQLTKRIDWSNPFRLLYVGRLSDSQKRIFLLPSILRACTQRGVPATLTIIGDGGDRLELEQLIVAEGLGHLVEMRGSQPIEAVYQAMQAHHVLLLPSIFEGFPLVIVEAHANGCVPVASHLAGITDMAIEDGVSGLLAMPNDPVAFARQIGVLAAEPNLWRKFSQAAIQRTQTKFSAETMGERYHALLCELASGAAPFVQHRDQPNPLLTIFTWHDFLPSCVQAGLRKLRRSLRMQQKKERP